MATLFRLESSPSLPVDTVTTILNAVLQMDAESCQHLCVEIAPKKTLHIDLLGRRSMGGITGNKFCACIEGPPKAIQPVVEARVDVVIGDSRTLNHSGPTALSPKQPSPYAT